MTFKKVARVIHLWLGLASGLVVFIVSITGCIFAFEEELFHLFHRRLVYAGAPAHAAVLPASLLKARAQEALGSADTINAVNVFGDPGMAYEFNVFQGSHQADDGLFEHPGLNWKRVYVNQYTGEVNGVFDMEWEFFITVRAIHQNLLLDPQIGSPIVGSATIIFMVLLLSGLVLWWPQNKAAARQRFRFKWKETTRWKRRNYDLHNIPGFYVLVVGLFLGLTGIVWSFQWWENTVYRMLDGQVVQFKLARNPNPGGAHHATLLDRKLEALRSVYPDYKRIYLSEISSTNTLLAAVNRPGKDLWTHYDYHQYDLTTGREYDRLLHNSKTRGQKWRNSNYDLHTGKTLGLPGMILAFAASLVCASLPVTGTIIWWGRKKNHQKKRA